MINKHIRCEKYILYFLNYFNIPEDSYTLGTNTNNSICVIENDDGYLVFDNINNKIENETFVTNFFDVVRVIYEKVVLSKLSKEKVLKIAN